MWTSTSFIDTVTTAGAAECVRERLQNPSLPYDSLTNPLVKFIEPDLQLRGLAAMIMHYDIIERLRAFSHWDFSGKWPNGTWKHGSYEAVAQCAAADLDAALAAAATGAALLPVALNGGGDFLWSGMATEPRCGAFVVTGPNPRLAGTLQKDTSGRHSFVPGTEHYVVEPDMVNRARVSYSPATAEARAAKLLAAVAVHQTRNVDMDVGLATTIASSRTAARAAFLSRAQAACPERGYT